MALVSLKIRAYIRFKVAADDDYHARSEYMVGMIHEYGEGERLNRDKALKYYKRSARIYIDAQDKLNNWEESIEC